MAVAAGWHRVSSHPLFQPLSANRQLRRDSGGPVPHDGWAVIDSDGHIDVHPTRRATADEWSWVFAHLLLHLGMDHPKPEVSGGQHLDRAHTAACDVVVLRFQETLKFGTCPILRPSVLPPGDERSLAER